MKKLKAIFLKFLIGYFFNTIAISLLVLLFYWLFKLDIFDSVLILGIAILFLSFMVSGKFVRTLPAASPLGGGDDSGIGDPAAHAAVLNVLVADFENRNRITDNSSILPVEGKGLKYLILSRSQIELISYAVLLVLFGLIKYYSYF